MSTWSCSSPRTFLIELRNWFIVFAIIKMSNTNLINYNHNDDDDNDIANNNNDDYLIIEKICLIFPSSLQIVIETNGKLMVESKAIFVDTRVRRMEKFLNPPGLALLLLQNTIDKLALSAHLSIAK